MGKHLERIEEMVTNAKGDFVSLEKLKESGMSHKEALKGLKELIDKIEKNPYCGYKYNSTEDGTLVWKVAVNEKAKHATFWKKVRTYVEKRKGCGFGVSRYNEEHPHRFYNTCETLWGYTENKRNFLLLVYDYDQVFIPQFYETLPLSKSILKENIKKFKDQVEESKHKEIDRLYTFLASEIEKKF